MVCTYPHTRPHCLFCKNRQHYPVQVMQHCSPLCKPKSLHLAIEHYCSFRSCLYRSELLPPSAKSRIAPAWETLSDSMGPVMGMATGWECFIAVSLNPWPSLPKTRHTASDSLSRSCGTPSDSYDFSDSDCLCCCVPLPHASSSP